MYVFEYSVIANTLLFACDTLDEAHATNPFYAQFMIESMHKNKVSPAKSSVSSMVWSFAKDHWIIAMAYLYSAA